MNDIKLKLYSNAYKEIYEILKIFPEELVSKIPKEKILFYKKHMNNNYQYNITKDNFKDIPMMNETQAIFANLFKDYWANSLQRQKINAKERHYLNKIEQEKRKKYNTDNIFKNNKYEKKPIVSLVEVKNQKWYEKVFSFFKNVFKKFHE